MVICLWFITELAGYSVSTRRNEISAQISIGKKKKKVEFFFQDK